MRKIIFSIIVFLCVFSLQAQEQETTTYYFIRHAEKNRADKTNKNPELTVKGHDRALYWSIVLKDIDFDMIYSTEYHRTVQTAEPTAESKQVEIQYYDPRNLYSHSFVENTKGKTVLVVGHSNTTPHFVNKVIGANKYPEIEDDNNSNLYIITVIGDQLTDILLKIEHQKSKTN